MTHEGNLTVMREVWLGPPCRGVGSKVQEWSGKKGEVGSKEEMEGGS